MTRVSLSVSMAIRGEGSVGIQQGLPIMRSWFEG